MLLGVVSGGWWYSSNVSEDPEGTTTVWRLRASVSQVRFMASEIMHHVGPLPLSYLFSHLGYASCIWQELYFLIPLWLQKRTSPPAFSLQSHLSFLCPPVASKGPALGLTDERLQCKEPSASAPWVPGLQAPPSLMQDFYPRNSGQLYKKIMKACEPTPTHRSIFPLGNFLTSSFQHGHSQRELPKLGEDTECAQNADDSNTLTMFHTA